MSIEFFSDVKTVNRNGRNISVIIKKKMQSTLSRGRSIVSKLFGRYLLPTNIVSGIGLAYLGDYAKQKIVLSRTTPTSSAIIVDHSQALKMGIASIPLSVEMHFWYKLLDRYFPTKSKSHVFTKVFLDESFMAPILTFTLISGLSLLERTSWDEFIFRMKHSFLPLLMVDIMFYAPVQCFNFYFFPTKYRTVVVYAASVVYFCVASYVIHEFPNFFKNDDNSILPLD